MSFIFSVTDVGIWIAGFFSAPASIATGFVKAIVDDDINRKLSLVQAKEPSQYASFIKACYNYGSASPSINAMTIANRGGTAWITSVGLWVYITDADVLEEMLVEVLAPTSNAYIAWTAIRYATPSARAALFDEAAHSSGYKDWGCSAINEHGHEVGSSHE